VSAGLACPPSETAVSGRFCLDKVHSPVACMLTELEQVWRGRIARIDELLASDTDQEN
jgi:hypothetical protein